ncbi:MAG: hypothetical protein DLM62_08380 [Pseudonocardiales bacterium]|nr:MAG: hypothetical protein DLM62_08380 [Pseudonocardiales bacterium]
MTAPVSRPDIADRGDIADLVTPFYRRVFADALLGPIFVDVAKVDMSVHLPVMCDFWETVAGSISRRLRGQPATQHVTIQRQHPDEEPS